MDIKNEHALQRPRFTPLQWVTLAEWYFRTKCMTPEKIIERMLTMTREEMGEAAEPILEFYTSYYECEKEGKTMNQGIELSFTTHCVLHAILHLHESLKGVGSFICNERDLYRAMKINKKTPGVKPSKIRESLEILATKKFPFLYMPQNQRVEFPAFGSLIDLETEERPDKEIKPPKGNGKSSHATSRYSRHYKITLNTNLFTPVKNSFRLMNPNIGSEIREYKKKHGGKPSEYDIRFYDLLVTENDQTIKRNFLDIADAPLLMRHLIKQRKEPYIRDRITKIYKLYKGLGYLEDFKLDQQGWNLRPYDILYLNPEKFYRARKNGTNNN